MPQIQKQSTKNAFYIYSGAVIGLVSNVLFGNYLTPAQNGVLALIVSYGSLMGDISNLGFGFAGVRYFPKMRNDSNHHSGFLFINFKYGLIAVAVLSIGFVISQLIWGNPKDELYNQFFYLAIVIGLGSMLYNVISYYMRFNFDTTTATLGKEFLSRLLVLIFFIPFALSLYNYTYFIYFYAFIFVLIPIILIGVVKRKNYLFLKNTFSKLTPEFKKQFKRACLFGVVTGVGASSLLYLDSIMVSKLLSVSEAGIYVRNFYFATIILMAARAIQGISQTHISEAFELNDFDAVYVIYSKSCLTQTIIGVLFFIGIWGNIDNVYEILPIEYEAGKYVILFIGFGNLFNMITGSNQLIIGASPYFKVNTYTVFLLLFLTVGFNLWLIPEFGITGAAIGTGLSSVLFNIIRSAFVFYKYKYQPYDRKYILIFILGFLAWFTSYLIPKQEFLLLDIFLRSVIISIIFLFPLYYFKISPDINKLIDSLLMLLLKKSKIKKG